MNYLPVALVASTVILFLLLFPEMRQYCYRIFIGRPNLRLVDLPVAFGKGRGFVMIQSNQKDRFPIWHTAVRLNNEQMSIIYHKSGDHKESIESVDISHLHKAGVVLIFHNQKVVTLKRIGGVTHEYPILSDKEKECVDYFMQNLRACVFEKNAH